jgi:hypothetical protein
MNVVAIQKMTSEKEERFAREMGSIGSLSTAMSDFSMSFLESRTEEQEDQDIEQLISLISREVAARLLKGSKGNNDDDPSSSACEGRANNSSIQSIDRAAVANLIVESVDKVKGLQKDYEKKPNTTPWSSPKKELYTLSPVKKVVSFSPTTTERSFPDNSSIFLSPTKRPIGIASRLLDQSSPELSHPDFWCADLLDFEEEEQVIEYVEISETEFDDDCSQVTDISEIFSSSWINEDCGLKGTALDTSKETRSVTVRSSVRFDDVTVREYEQILGDNPACKSGPSLSIGWKYKEYPPLRVNDFESVRRKIRDSSKWRLSRGERVKILRRLGYGEMEIADAVRRNNKNRSLRRQTVNNLGNQSIGKAIQNAALKMKSFFRKGSQGKPRITLCPLASPRSATLMGVV